MFLYESAEFKSNNNYEAGLRVAYVNYDNNYEVGLFGNQNTVCQPTTPKWRHTVERLKQVFSTPSV